MPDAMQACPAGSLSPARKSAGLYAIHISTRELAPGFDLISRLPHCCAGREHVSQVRVHGKCCVFSKKGVNADEVSLKTRRAYGRIGSGLA